MGAAELLALDAFLNKGQQQSLLDSVLGGGSMGGALSNSYLGGLGRGVVNLQGPGTSAAQSAGINAGAAAAPYVGAVGLPLSMYGMYDAYKDASPGTGALAGAGLGGSIAALAPTLGLNAALPGVGWMLGGGALLGALVGGFGHKKTTDVENKRLKRLAEMGIISKEAGDFPDETRNRSEQLADAMKNFNIGEDFRGFTPTGQWVNNRWLKSGNVADLTGYDIEGYAAFDEMFGTPWRQKLSDLQRNVVAQKALELGLVGEGKGSISVQDNPVLRKFAWDVLRGEMDDDVLKKWLNEQTGLEYMSPEALTAGAAAAKAVAASTAQQQNPTGGGAINTPQMGAPAPSTPGPMPIDPNSPVGQAVGNVGAGLPGGNRMYTGPMPQSWAAAAQQGARPVIGGQIAAALGGAPGGGGTDWNAKLASGEYRRGSQAAGGYVNNATNEWVAG